MIAIFIPSHLERVIEGYSKKEFVFVKTIEDIRGRVFTGQIAFINWHLREDYKNNILVIEAYEYLKQKQPNLFI